MVLLDDLDLSFAHVAVKGFCLCIIYWLQVFQKLAAKFIAGGEVFHNSSLLPLSS